MDNQYTSMTGLSGAPTEHSEHIVLKPSVQWARS